MFPLCDALAASLSPSSHPSPPSSPWQAIWPTQACHPFNLSVLAIAPTSYWLVFIGRQAGRQAEPVFRASVPPWKSPGVQLPWESGHSVHPTVRGWGIIPCYRAFMHCIHFIVFKEQVFLVFFKENRLWFFFFFYFSLLFFVFFLLSMLMIFSSLFNITTKWRNSLSFNQVEKLGPFNSVYWFQLSVTSFC